MRIQRASRSRISLLVTAGTILLTSYWVTVVPAALEAQERWYVVYHDALGSITIDTTRIQPLGADRYRVWTRNSSNSLSLQEWDCRGLRSRVVRYESPDPSRPLVSNADTTFLEMAPESRGEAYLRAACVFLKDWGKRAPKPTS